MVKEVDGHGVNIKIVKESYEDGIKRRTMFFEVGTDDKCSVNEELVWVDLAKYPEFDRDTLHISNTHDSYGTRGHVIMPPEATPVLRTGESKSHKAKVGGNSISGVIE